MSKPVELPRHVKKPGEWKQVNTQEELDAALADGWVLKLEPEADAPEADAVADVADVDPDDPTKPARKPYGSQKKK